MFVCHDQRNGTGCGAVNQDNAQFCKQCGRPLRFAVQLHNPDEVIGAYRIVRVIGHGGFGAVYEAQETASSARTVALKETFDPDQIQSYQAEFAVLARLQHPHLPRYDNVFTADGNGYLVMELVPGQSLEEVLKKQGGPLLEAQVLGYALQLCDALAYLHRQTPAILHRDIKPANVRLTPEGLIKLVDFGLVKEGGGTTRHSRRAVTPPYAPPEQWGIGGQHTDPRSDLYALGATLYHLLTGLEPPPATDRISMTPDPLLTPQYVNPTLSPAVAGAIVQSMALAVNQRPADAAALRRLLVGGGRTRRPPAAPATASPTPPVTPPAPRVTPMPPPPAPQARSGSDLPWLIGVALFVVLAGVMTLLSTYDWGRAILPAAPAPFSANTPLPAWTQTPPTDAAIADAPTAAAPIPPPATATPGPPPTSTPLSVATATPLVALAELTVNEQINIRSGPGTEHSIIGTAAPGDRFLITGRNEAGDWWEVAYNGKTGWVFKELVTLFVEEGEPVPVSIGIATTMPSSTNSSTSTPHQLPTQENSLPAPVAGAVRELGGIPFVYVTAGTFQMGASPEQVDAQVALCLETTANCQRSWWENQEPQKEEYLADYWIGQTEVTNAQFRRFMNANGYGTERYWSSDGWRWRNSNNITQPRCTDDRFNADDFNSADQPAICISIYEAQAYANWFTETSGYSARIPTVAEWEKAARGADGRLFPWGDTTPTISLANINRYVGTTTPVGSYPAGMSLYGCLDMAGNVREWTTDWYTSSYDGSTGPINMGGSWLSSRNDAAIPRQSWASPDAIYTDNGFRLVCDVIGE